jgi:radical SAM superfamily enzyme YgiQ (UPF0313 family)
VAKKLTQSERIRERLKMETGTLFKGGGLRVGLVYPSPYRIGMSSLGYQAIYRVINRETAHTAERAFLPDDGDTAASLLTYESATQVGNCDVIAFSLSYELELIGVIECLRLAGLKPLAQDREPTDPLVVLGGPITFSNAVPAGPFADIIIMGEGESLIIDVLDRIQSATDRDGLLEDLAAVHGIYIPSLHGEKLPPVAKADDALLPAYSQIITIDTELSNMHLVEAERGCHRRCTFCVMRRSTNGGMRTAPCERILATIPEHAKRVGLVGAAVTDHPQLLDILEGILAGGREVGISSLRSDRLTPELMTLLRRGGYRTLTVACDGASERLRKAMMKSIRARHLKYAAELARAHKMRVLKLYLMLGVPDETDEDLEELLDLVTELTAITPVALTVSPFVAKRNTPLDGQRFAGVNIVDKRLKLLRRGLRGRAEIRGASARWAWVEYCIAQGGFEMAAAAVDAHAAGARFADWKQAVRTHSPRFLDDLDRKVPSRVRAA